MSGGDSDADAGLEIGRALELARKRRGLSLKEVEQATKIRAGYLSELEQENFDVLPAVYVQGYLKTYASFLHLDADPLVGEFKRRRALSEEPPYPLYVGPKEDDSLDDILTALGGAAKSRDATGDEEDTRPALLPAGFDARLYLGSAAFLLLCAAVVVLALAFAGNQRQPAVSQVREPLVSQPPEASPTRAQEEASVQSPQQGDEQKAENGHNKQQGNEDKAKSETDRPDHSMAEEKEPESQNSASATASASPAAQRGDRRDQATAKPSRRDVASAEPPAPQNRSAPPSSPRPSRQPAASPSGGNGSQPPRNDGEMRVRVVVGARDPVQLSGGPFDD